MGADAQAAPGGSTVAARAGGAAAPPPTTFWGILRAIGPGLILTANIVGTGELIATTRLGAEVGFTLLWFIIFSCFIKVFVQVELARYTVAEGVGSIDALNRLPGPRFRVSWIVWLWFFMYVGTLCQVSGMIGGIAELLADRSEVWVHRGWAAAIALGTAAILVGGRYGVVERVSTTLVVVFTLSNIAAVLLLAGTPFHLTGAQLSEGLSFHLPDEVITTFAVFGITGVGAAELIYYPIWCLEKGYARSAGPRDDSPEWLARAQGWMRVMKIDAWVSMAVYTVGTLSFYLLGAAILNREGLTVGNADAIDSLAVMYVHALGDSGRWLFYIGGFMVLYSTLFVSTASNARLAADAGRLAGLFTFRSPADRLRIIRWAVVILPIATLLIYVRFESLVTLVLIGGVAQALMLPFLAGAAVYFHHHFIPEGLRSGRAWTAFLWISFLAMTAVGLFQVWRAAQSLAG
jgi:Mn2+/Fe2+ NRAMP family transporter